MGAQAKSRSELPQELPAYHSILLACDSSDHANRAIAEVVALAGLWGANVTGTHVYAARMHDVRFRQMEGGLPDPYREERELERQRDVHDDLITRGLSIITDSYLDQVERACKQAAVRFARRSLEGKNYRELVKEANGGKYDLMVLGSLGLGVVDGSRLGTVCQRVVRRTDIDTLVIKEPRRAISEGPIVVAVDGSARAYGGLLSALALSRHWEVPIQVVAAFDPYYHYVAFNRIAGVLSEEAGKVFRFRDQEKLHEDIIDSGLAKIYEGHLRVAETLAADHGVAVETRLLDGKPHDAIERHLREVNPALLVIGKVGIHADPELDIGGNAENLLRNVDCSVLLSQRMHQPRIDQVAEVTTSWTREAERRMERVPTFVRDMARLAILRYAQERGHTVITERIVEEATEQLMPGRAEQFMQEIVSAHGSDQSDDADGDAEHPREDPFAPLTWSHDAASLLQTVGDPALRKNLRMRAEKKARTAGFAVVGVEHARQFIVEAREFRDGDRPDRPGPGDADTNAGFHWEAAALARLMRVPEGFMRDASRQRIEDHARRQSIHRITLEVVEQGLAEARGAMERTLGEKGSDQAAATLRSSNCPFANPGGLLGQVPPLGKEVPWTREAESRLLGVPEGFCRDMTRRAADTIAAQSNAVRIDGPFVERVMSVFQSGSEEVTEKMPWDEGARARIAHAPDMIRGMLIREIEGWAERNGRVHIDEGSVESVREIWRQRGLFHLDPGDPRSGTPQS